MEQLYQPYWKPVKDDITERINCFKTIYKVEGMCKYISQPFQVHKLVSMKMAVDSSDKRLEAKISFGFNPSMASMMPLKPLGQPNQRKESSFQLNQSVMKLKNYTSSARTREIHSTNTTCICNQTHIQKFEAAERSVLVYLYTSVRTSQITTFWFEEEDQLPSQGNIHWWSPRQVRSAQNTIVCVKHLWRSHGWVLMSLDYCEPD